MIHAHSNTPRWLNHDLPVGRGRCERCDRPLVPLARVRLCRPCRRRRHVRLELAGYKGPDGVTPPVEMDPTRQERIARYAARAAAGLPLFGGAEV